jgi:5-(carboxyamino)imidazole ribonucleotide mutase
MTDDSTPIVGVIMGSQSDWPTLEKAAQTLSEFGVKWESKVVSAHRTPDLLYEYANSAKSRGLKCIIAGAGVPIKSRTLNGVDSLLSIVQMPAGVPTATFAIGDAGAINAALFAVSMLASAGDENLAQKLDEFRKNQSEKVKASELSPPGNG